MLDCFKFSHILYFLLCKNKIYNFLHNSTTKIITYVMTWDGIVTTLHKKDCKDVGLDARLDGYIQSSVLKMTLESMSFDYRGRAQDEEEELVCTESSGDGN